MKITAGKKYKIYHYKDQRPVIKDDDGNKITVGKDVWIWDINNGETKAKYLEVVSHKVMQGRY